MTAVAGLVPLLCFALLLAMIHRRVEFDLARDWRITFITAAVAWGLSVLLLTELLSALGSVSRPTLIVGWAVLAAVVALAARPPAEHARANSAGTMRASFLDSPLDRTVAATAAAIVAALAILSIVAPPNTWDSMTYHMGRVAHWAQNHSISHYPTTISRQLYLTPWAEYAVLHFQLLTGGDRWANLVQWMAMVGSAIGASFLTSLLGGSRSAQLSAAAIVVAIPMGILQATSTQTDYATAFWVVSFASFSMLLMRAPADPPRGLTILAGVALGLAMATKATTLPFALPFIVWLITWSVRQRALRRVTALAVIGVVAASMSVGHYWRNQMDFGRMLGPDIDVNQYSNETHSPSAIASNVIRNIALHVPTPLSTVNRISLRTVARVHSFLGIDMSDPRTTFEGERFDIGKPRYHEDLAGNFVHAGLLIFSLAVMVAFPRDDSDRRAYALALAAGFLTFSYLLKWQPWGSRLQMPFFVLGAPLIALTLWQLLRPNTARAVTALVLLASLPWVLFNESRMLVPRPSRSVLWDRNARTVFNTSRRDMYFRNRPELAEPYEAAAQKIEAAGCREVGLVIGSDDYEYPFWVLLDQPQGSRRLSHDMSHAPGGSGSPTAPFCAVIVSDGADVDPGAVPSLRTEYQTEWASPPYVTVFLDPRRP